MKMNEVCSIARNLGINCFGKKKVELIKEIQRKEGNFDCFGSAQTYCDQLECIFRSSCMSEDIKPGKAGRV